METSQSSQLESVVSRVVRKNKLTQLFRGFNRLSDNIVLSSGERWNRYCRLLKEAEGFDLDLHLEDLTDDEITNLLLLVIQYDNLEMFRSYVIDSCLSLWSTSITRSTPSKIQRVLEHCERYTPSFKIVSWFADALMIGVSYFSPWLMGQLTKSSPRTIYEYFTNAAFVYRLGECGREMMSRYLNGGVMSRNWILCNVLLKLDPSSQAFKITWDLIVPEWNRNVDTSIEFQLDHDERATVMMIRHVLDDKNRATLGSHFRLYLTLVFPDDSKFKSQLSQDRLRFLVNLSLLGINLSDLIDKDWSYVPGSIEHVQTVIDRVEMERKKLVKLLTDLLCRDLAGLVLQYYGGVPPP